MKRSPVLYRDILSAACALGVSSTFGSPIGGVLFSVEVTSTIYRTTSYWKGFFASVISAWLFNQLSIFSWFSRNSLTSLFSTSFGDLPYSHWELVLFFFVSAISGACGGINYLFYPSDLTSSLSLSHLTHHTTH